MTMLSHLSDEQRQFCIDYVKQSFLNDNVHFNTLKKSEKYALSMMIKSQPDLKEKLIAPLSPLLAKEIIAMVTQPDEPPHTPVLYKEIDISKLENTLITLIQDPAASLKMVLAPLKRYRHQLTVSDQCVLTQALIQSGTALTMILTTQSGLMMYLNFHYVLSELLPVCPEYIRLIVPGLDDLLLVLPQFPSASDQYRILNKLPLFTLQLLLKRLSHYQKISALQMRTIYSKLYHQIKDDLSTLPYDKIKQAITQIGGYR